jgi:hypothetical protein
MKLSVRKYQTKKFGKAKKITMKIMRIRSDRKKMIEGEIVKTLHYKNYLR